MVTLVFIILAISVLILVHEWGHFFVSRKLDVGVEEFGFGFPPRLVSRVRNGIRYSFNLFPFGGFVKIFGEHGEGEDDHRSFASRPAWQRIMILGAGVAMNLVLAWVVFSIGAAMGVLQATDRTDKAIPVSIIAVMPDSPAERAGFKLGDQILEIRTSEISLRIESEDDVRNFIDAYRGEEITLVLGRGESIREVKTIPRKVSPDGQGPLGIAMARLAIVRTPWYRAPIEGFKTLTLSTLATVEGFGFIVQELLHGRGGSIPVSGPIGIYRYAEDTAQFGFAYFLQFIGILSVNLAIINALPIPALDGGRIFFIVLERMRGKRIRPQLENTIHAAGFVTLVLLMVLVTYRDIANVL